MNKKNFPEKMPSKADLKNWLANGKIKETIDVLLNLAKESEDNDLENSIVQQANRFNKLHSEEVNGVLASEETQVRRGKIIQSLLSIIDGLDNVIPSSKIKHPSPNLSPTSTWIRQPNLLGIIIMIGLTIAISLYFINESNVKETSLSQAEITKLIELANQSFQTEKWNDASDYYSRLLKIEPENPLFLEKYGFCLYNQNQYPQAKKVFDLAIEKTQGKAYQIFFFRGNTNLAVKDFQSALLDFDELIKLSPNHPAGHNQRGHAYRELGDMEKACLDYRKALQLGNQVADINIKKYCQ